MIEDLDPESPTLAQDIAEHGRVAAQQAVDAAAAWSTWADDAAQLAARRPHGPIPEVLSYIDSNGEVLTVTAPGDDQYPHAYLEYQVRAAVTAADAVAGRLARYAREIREGTARSLKDVDADDTADAGAP